MKRLLYFFLLILVSVTIPNNAFSKRQKPLIWDMEQLERMRKDVAGNQDAIMIIQYADKYCTLTPSSVTQNKKFSFGPTEHYYSSMGPYRWPDKTRPGKYVLKDGEMNPDWKYYDGGKLNDMALRCQRLSQAFYLTKDKKYYNAFIKQINVWFLDNATYMEPNFEFAQVIPGDAVNVGTSSGMIEAYAFNTLIESLRLVHCTKRIKRRTYKALQEWFYQFATWSEDRYGDYFKKANNNISLAFDVTMTNIYLFSGQSPKAREIADSFSSKRLEAQIKEDGSQPAELIRTRAAYYSLYNISHIIDFCRLTKYWGNNYWTQYEDRINKAFGYLQQYIENPDTFPYQQITSWDECMTMFNEEQQRLRLLKK